VVRRSAVSRPLNDKASYVSAFAIDRKTGKLKLLTPCRREQKHLSHFARSDRQYVMVASFGSGSATVIRLNDDGSLGAQDCARPTHGPWSESVFQSGPRAHTICHIGDNRFAVVADFGIDKLIV